jgi:hypothetical protein
VIQGCRFLAQAVAVGDPVAVGLHIGLLAAINIAVFGTLSIALAYTGNSWSRRRWLVATVVVLGVALPLVRLTTASAGTSNAELFADADFFYRFILGLAALAILARQLVSARGIYRTQGAVLLVGLVIVMTAVFVTTAVVLGPDLSELLSGLSVPELPGG